MQKSYIKLILLFSVAAIYFNINSAAQIEGAQELTTSGIKEDIAPLNADEFWDLYLNVPFTKNIEKIKKIIRSADFKKLGIDINEPFSITDITMISQAIQHGDVELVKLLMDKGGKINLDSALIKAAKFGNIDLVEFFLSQGANFDEQVIEQIRQDLRIKDKLIDELKKGIETAISIGYDSGADLQREQMKEDIAIKEREIQIIKLLEDRLKAKIKTAVSEKILPELSTIVADYAVGANQ